MRKVASRSLLSMLKKLGTRAALLLLAWLMLRPGKKKQVALMIAEATLGGHRIRYEKQMSRTRNEEGEFDVLQEGHDAWITPTAWIERRRNLVAQSVVTDDRGPFSIAGMPVLAITSESPTVRTFRFPSPVDVNQDEHLTMDLTSPEGKAFVNEWVRSKRDFKAWSSVPCILTDSEAAELKMLDLVYRVCVDLGLQQEKHMAWSDPNVQKIAAIEQERTKGGVAEFSGRPDDGMAGFVGGGTSVYPGKEYADRTMVTFEAAAWSMSDEEISLNGFIVPQRPSPKAFMLDEAWGWNCRLDLTKQMVKMEGEAGNDVWLDTREPAFKQMDPHFTNRLRRISVLKVDPVRVEVGKDHRCAVRSVQGKPKTIEPIGIIRRHLHNLIQMGYASFVLKPYVCKVCNGKGYITMVDPDTGQIMMGGDDKPMLYDCGKCRGSGCGAPGYHIDYRTGLATPNVPMAKVIKPISFACKGKKAKCGNREFYTDIHAEVCTKCGSEMWKNSLIMLFDSAHTSEAYDLPEDATHSAVQVYGQLVRDMVLGRINRVNKFLIAGKKVPSVIGTPVVMGKSGLMPNVLDAWKDRIQPDIKPTIEYRSLATPEAYRDWQGTVAQWKVEHNARIQSHKEVLKDTVYWKDAHPEHKRAVRTFNPKIKAAYAMWAKKEGK